MKRSALESLVRHGVRLAVMFVFLAGMAGLSRAQVPAASQPSPKAAASAASARTTSTEPQALSPAVPTRAMQMYAALPMSFEANAGQTDRRVKFLAHAPGYSLFLTSASGGSFAFLSRRRPRNHRAPATPLTIRNHLRVGIRPTPVQREIFRRQRGCRRCRE